MSQDIHLKYDVLRMDADELISPPDTGEYCPPELAAALPLSKVISISGCNF